MSTPQLTMESVVAKFSVAQGDIYCVNENNHMSFFLAKDKLIDKDSIKQIDLDKDAIPREYFSNERMMRSFLSQANIRLVEYGDHSGYKLKVNLGLDGGGNMMGPNDKGHKWPVKPVGENAKIVIPYSLKTSDKYTAATRLYNEPKTSKRRAKFMSDLNNGLHKDLESEMTARESIDKAIDNWNETGVVQLVSITEYKRLYGSAPIRWIGFRTQNKEGICEAPCIGMCAPVGEHIINCDIEKRFFSDPVQSIMHEIGHVIGLRHEHARIDRDDNVATNLDEDQDGIAFGKYDFYSIMHYALGNYGDHEYLRLSQTLEKERSEKNKRKLMREVGKAPWISHGDIQTVRKLYAKEFKALTEEANAKEKSDNEFTQQFSALSLASKGNNKKSNSATPTATHSATSKTAAHSASAAHSAYTASTSTAATVPAKNTSHYSSGGWNRKK